MAWSWGARAVVIFAINEGGAAFYRHFCCRRANGRREPKHLKLAASNLKEKRPFWYKKTSARHEELAGLRVARAELKEKRRPIGLPP